MYLGRINPNRSSKKVLIIFIVISFLLVGFVLYSFLSQAVISLTPQKEATNVDFEFDVVDKKGDGQAQKTELLGSFWQRTIKGSKKIAVGEMEIEKRPAGKVTLYNKKDSEQPLLEQTQLKSESGVIFRTDEGITIPPQEKMTVGVKSDVMGSQGEIGPSHFTVVKLPPEWQNVVYGESSEPMRGGKVKSKLVTAELTKQAQGEIIDEMVNKFKNDAGDKKILYQQNIMESNADAKEGEEVDNLFLSIKADFKGVTFDDTRLGQLAEAKIKEKRGENLEIVKKQDLKYELISWEDKKVKAKAIFSANTEVKLPDSAYNKESLFGKNKKQIEDYYREIKEVETVDVFFSPFWVKKVPSMSDHVEVIIKN